VDTLGSADWRVRDETTSGSDRPVRVLIIDDHAFFRAGVRSVLVEHGFEVVGEAARADIGIALAARRAPDAILMDLNMPGMSGVDATRQLGADGVTVPVVVLTVSAAEDDLLDALEAGAAGYLLKSAPPDEIVRSIRAAVAGEAPLSAKVARHLVERTRARPGRMESRSATHERLSEREIEVLRLLADGLDNAQIAHEMHLSPATVKRHVSAILTKLGVTNRVQAAIQGVQLGLV
jgi:DNA-binding NarL/FixJ family response regulator